MAYTTGVLSAVHRDDTVLPTYVLRQQSKDQGKPGCEASQATSGLELTGRIMQGGRGVTYADERCDRSKTDMLVVQSSKP